MADLSHDAQAVFRALCAELVQAWDDSDELVGYEDFGRAASYLVDRARAAQAQQQQWPTDEEILAAVRHLYRSQRVADMAAEDDIRTARAVLARWGGVAPLPVAVNERLPKPEDCDEQGWCWRWNRIQRGWLLQPLHRRLYEFEPYWLPANALPQPEVEG